MRWHDVNNQYGAIGQMGCSSRQLDSTPVDAYIEVSPTAVRTPPAPDQFGIRKGLESMAFSDAVLARRSGEPNLKRHTGRLSYTYDNQLR